MFRTVGRSVCLIAVLVASGCSPSCPNKLKIRPFKHISNFTFDHGFVYFGAGYHLYRIDLAAQSVEPLYTTDSIKVEQPLVVDGVAYFGGSSHRLTDQDGKAWGEDSGFFALDLQSRQIQWKFPLGVRDYDTFGTFPVIAGDRILVCARKHLHCLDRHTGREIWKLDNWFGDVGGDGVTLPFVYHAHVYFKIAEEYFTNTREIDGYWAEVALDNGQRTAVLPVVRSPGDYHDKTGEGTGRLVDGVIYGKTHHDRTGHDLNHSGRFGAIDLEAHRLLWEIQGSSLRTRPAVNDRYVFTVRENAIQALDRKTGEVIWSDALGEIADPDSDGSRRWDDEYELSRRFAATNDMVVLQGSQGIAVREANTGKALWFFKALSNRDDVDPLIVQQIVIASAVNESSVFALDLTSGKELWRVRVPDCTYYYAVKPFDP